MGGQIAARSHAGNARRKQGVVLGHLVQLNKEERRKVKKE